MTLKDILVHIDDSEHVPIRLNAAVALAERHGAHLSGWYGLPGYPVGLYADAYIEPMLIPVDTEAMQIRARAREEQFRAAVAQAGLSADWHCVEDDPLHRLTHQIRCHDLVILGQADPQDLDGLPNGVIGQLLLGAGRPLLIVPYIGAAPTLGERILIAWNGSREAARAVNDALPLLRNAKEVRVVTLAAPAAETAQEDPSATAIGRHLACHGIGAAVGHLPAADIDVGDALLSRAADDNIDLIVMGAYGHSRLREIVLGSVTERLLSAMTVPVLMSH